jgi:hypothetical protein
MVMLFGKLRTNDSRFITYVIEINLVVYSVLYNNIFIKIKYVQDCHRANF